MLKSSNEEHPHVSQATDACPQSFVSWLLSFVRFCITGWETKHQKWPQHSISRAANVNFPIYNVRAKTETTFFRGIATLQQKSLLVSQIVMHILYYKLLWSGIHFKVTLLKGVTVQASLCCNKMQVFKVSQEILLFTEKEPYNIARSIANNEYAILYDSSWQNFFFPPSGKKFLLWAVYTRCSWENSSFLLLIWDKHSLISGENLSQMLTQTNLMMQIK